MPEVLLSHGEMRAGPYAVTLFTSAFLLFLLQPMIARFVLPWFGGGSGVWSACLLFFQSILLLGYLYAHGLARLLGLRAQTITHSLLLLLSVALLPISPAGSLASTQSELPTLQLLWILLRSVGLPCLLIAASAPLLQHWFAQQPGLSPYRLYAVSNLGSLLGLLCYPSLVEPLFGLGLQADLWSLGYLLLVALSLLCAGLVARHGTARVTSLPSRSKPYPAWPSILLWLGLSGAGVILLLSITTELTTNLVPMPLLWVLPLSLYLVSFIVCFAREKSDPRRLWLSLFCIAILPTLWLPAIEPLVGAWPSVLLSCLCLFSGCMVCHGELARLRPSRDDLSLYYLVLALGGVLGSAFVTFAAPLLFERYWELAIALFGIFALAGLCIGRSGTDKPLRANPLGLQTQERTGFAVGLFLLWALGGAAFAFLGTLPLRAQDGTVAAQRSFYGRLSVVETRVKGAQTRLLVHGRIRHGSQYTSETRRREATLYYSPDSGVALALEHYAREPGRHIGVLGLGVGTLASYGNATDRIRFYELDPLVLEFANRYFTFLSGSVSDVQVVLGDGRLSLDREWSDKGSNDFDLLVIDAFNADAVPTHLLTREAFELYWKHLGDQGTLALHITNAFLDLAPVVEAQAQALGKEVLLIRARASDLSNSGSTWVLVTNNAELLQDPSLRSRASVNSGPAEGLWTDDYSNILQALE